MFLIRHQTIQMKLLYFFAFPVFFLFCKNAPVQQPPNQNSTPVYTERAALQKPKPILNPDGATISERFNPPIGFERIEVADGSYQDYLRNLPLLSNETPVLLFNGSKKYRQDVHAAVVDLDVGKRDLQQCADAVMRLRAEYLLSQQEFDKIHFNFTNGFNAEYQKWRSGNRISVKGNHVSWVGSNSESESYSSFRKYLDMVFSYAGTWSFEKELMHVDIKDMQIGDVFIQGGSPGHAIIVIDMAEDKNSGKKLFMVAQSYMPAQNIHVLKNQNNNEISPWYEMEFGDELKTPEWIFKRDNLKRFEE